MTSKNTQDNHHEHTHQDRNAFSSTVIFPSASCEMNRYGRLSSSPLRDIWSDSQLRETPRPLPTFESRALYPSHPRMSQRSSRPWYGLMSSLADHSSRYPAHQPRDPLAALLG